MVNGMKKKGISLLSRSEFRPSVGHSRGALALQLYGIANMHTYVHQGLSCTKGEMRTEEKNREGRREKGEERGEKGEGRREKGEGRRGAFMNDGTSCIVA